MRNSNFEENERIGDLKTLNFRKCKEINQIPTSRRTPPRLLQVYPIGQVARWVYSLRVHVVMCRGARYCLNVALADGTRGKIAFVRRMPKMRQLIELLRGTFLHYTFCFSPLQDSIFIQYLYLHVCPKRTSIP